ncbi:MAG: Panacea domain-containing protein [Pyrinomonadaceae bacterium]
MLINRSEREKLINAIMFFAHNTELCGKTKLFKLLFFLDFEHYKAIGRSVTGLTYKAWPRGPLPPELDEEIKHDIMPDMVAKIRFDEHSKPNGKKFVKVTPRGYFNHKVFSRREMKIMRRLAADFKYHDAADMIEETHLPNKPWDRVFKQEKRPHEEIPYDYGVPEEDKDFVQYIKGECDEFISHYGN